ncbi:MAG: hypothetical protein CHACPFDD_02633 [Phycisphaerae bacterium]|nr:hypothetical protein [Phycisphaerae bacterium]
MIRICLARATAFLALAALAPAVHAQLHTNARVSRPSEFSASRNVGRTGGLNTGRYKDTSPGRRLGADRGIGASVRTGRRGGGALANSTLYAQSDLVDPSTLPYVTRFRSGAIDSSRVTQGELAVASGFYGAIRLDTPLRGRTLTLPPLTTPIVGAESDVDPYRRYFDLKPAEPAANDVTAQDISDLMRLDTKLDAISMRTRGRDAFKAGQFRDASSLLVTAHRMDPRGSHGDLVLAAHAAVEGYQFSSAVNWLMMAVEERPELFVEGLPVKEFYGDPDEMDRQMRLLSRITGEDNWTAQVLKCYGAWQLGDKVTALAAMDAAQKAGEAADERIATQVNAFVNAMRPALAK